ncbi:MAG: ABC transporter ATP-binding protein [Candidatus Acetothermia bacterium]|jgi:simple sugar transport system ATP-binding protein|nr:ABC transporter ATP-binding protein [Candidatus Acetothermia bacterium]MDH7504660.1 ABC transporter ATP-binding protein [Candidatus Acetothermia bacterium]
MTTAQRPIEKGEVLLEGKGISKGFPGVWEYLILDHIDFDVRAGEVHTLLGENGAGKTVIANILSGFYSLTSGQLFVRGEPVTLRSPRDGLEHGIGMVHQELMLVRTFTVAENVALGLKAFGLSFPLRRVEQRLRELSERYQLQVDPRARIEDLSAGEQQRVEILKVLYHEPQVLILDEPTSLLTPEEAERLFEVLRGMAAEGHGIVFITHKMKEVFKVSDRVTVLKLGKAMGTKPISETSEEELSRLMFGEHIDIHIERKPVRSEKIALEVQNLEALGPEGEPALRGVSFAIREGEIFGIAGVAGNGQSELIEAVTGLRRVTGGRVIIFGRDMTNRSPREIIEAGVAHIPEKRREIGVVEPMNVAENVVLKDYRKPPFSRRSILNIPYISRHSEKVVAQFEALVPDLWRSQTRILSGGNIQRLILGRETWRRPPLIVAAHPTEGLDARAIRHTWGLFLSLRGEGSAILLVSEDLDEVMALSDRIAVMFEGKIVGLVEGAEARREEIGLLMAGIRA